MAKNRKNILCFIGTSRLDHTLFENYQKCRIWCFSIFTNFCPIKIYPSGNNFWLQDLGFNKIFKIGPYWHFQWTFVRFARNVEWDFFFDFQTPYSVGCNFIFANSFVKGDNAERVLVRRAKIDAIHGGIAVGKLLMGCNWLLSHMTTVVVRTHEKMLAQKLTRSILQGK